MRSLVWINHQLVCCSWGSKVCVMIFLYSLLASSAWCHPKPKVSKDLLGRCQRRIKTGLAKLHREARLHKHHKFHPHPHAWTPISSTFWSLHKNNPDIAQYSDTDQNVQIVKREHWYSNVEVEGSNPNQGNYFIYFSKVWKTFPKCCVISWDTLNQITTFIPKI